MARSCARPWRRSITSSNSEAPVRPFARREPTSCLEYREPPLEFIATYCTLAGDLVLLGLLEQKASPHDFAARVATAAGLGYGGLEDRA